MKAQIVETESEVVESVLEQLGLTHRRRDNGWSVPPAARCPRELLLVAGEDGLRVEMTLISLEGAGNAERQAVETFLRLARPQLPFTQTELLQDQVVLTANVPAADIESKLEHAVGGVLAAEQALSRELAGLLQPELARHYLAFVATQREILATASRM